MTLLEQILHALITPLEFLSSPDKRVFWPCLITALVLAFWVYAKPKLRPTGFFQYLFAKDIWLSKSAILDYQLSITNGLIKIFVNASSLLPMAGVAAMVSTLLDWTVAAPELQFSRTTITASYTLALFLVGDVTRYLLHRMLHEIPSLWAFHQTHHSATVLNPFTVYRVHPVESFLFGLRRTLSTGFTTGIFIWLFGTSLSGFDVLGVNAIGLAFNVLGANLRHSHVWFSYGTTLEKIFISPAQHQIHHSIESAHYNKNYGTCLSMWDKIGGSWVEAGPERMIRFGLPGSLKAPPQGLLRVLAAPFIQLIKGA